MTIDEAMLECYTGGGGVVVEGRHIGQGSFFKYTWQAGFLFVFNEGDCPKFDAADQAFVERMVVAPMRSKFVAGDIEAGVEFTYPVVKDIEARFPLWLSAMADIFLESYDVDALDAIPPSMSEWRQVIAGDRNELAEWLQQKTVVTGDVADVVMLRELRQEFNRTSGAVKKNAAEFLRLSRAFFGTFPSTRYVPSTTIVGLNVNDVIRGASRAACTNGDA